MEKLLEFFMERMDAKVKGILKESMQKQEEKNPNQLIQKAAIETLRQIIDTEKTDKEDVFNLGLLCCTLTEKMKADQKIIELLEKINHPIIKIYIVYFQESPANYLESLKRIEELSKEVEKREDFSQEQKAIILHIHSWIYGQQGEIERLKEILRYAKERLTKSNNHLEQRNLQEAFLNVVWWFLHSGVDVDFTQLLEFLDPIIDRFKFYKTYTSYLNVRGAIESFFGFNHDAIKSFQLLVKTHQKYKDDYRLSIGYGNLAEVYAVIGKIKQAKNLMEKAIKLYKDSTDKWPYLYLTELGNLYYLLGDERAEKSFLHAYEIQRHEKSLHKAFIMYELVHFYLRSERLAKVKKYLRELRTLSKELETPSINARVDYLRGFYESLNHNLSNAIGYLKSALEQARLTKDAELILYSNIQLAITHLTYYRLLEKQEQLNLAITYIDTVRQLAVEYNHKQLLATSLIIRAVLTVVNGEEEVALHCLENAKQIVSELEFPSFIQDIEKIEKKIIEAERTREIYIEKQPIIEYILPQFKSLLSLKLSETKKKETEVLGILIISESGIPIYSKLKDKLKANDLILSGLLMAINQFAENISEGKEIRRLLSVNYEDFSITLQAIKNGIIAIIASEVSSELRIWAITLADRIPEIPPVISEFTAHIPNKIEDLFNQVDL